MTQKSEISLLSGHGISLYSDLMVKSVGGVDHRQRLECVTEGRDVTALPDDFEDGAFEDGDLQDADAEDPYQFADPSQFTDVGRLGDDHTDPWDVFLTDGDWAEPEPERGDFWLDDR